MDTYSQYSSAGLLNVSDHGALVVITEVFGVTSLVNTVENSVKFGDAVETCTVVAVAVDTAAGVAIYNKYKCIINTFI